MNKSEAELMAVLQSAVSDLKVYHPRTILLFGSLARHLSGDPSAWPPNDIDLIMVGNNSPYRFNHRDYGVTIELNLFTTHQMVSIARSLRYDPKPIALSRLYSKNVLKQHARDVIAACLLLGPTYNDFGIEQIEIDGRIDPRDYSVHRILQGERWWQRLQSYAAERRGALKRFSDKLVRNDQFRE
jgi:hypothetical protein